MEFRKFMRGSVPEYPKGALFPEYLKLRDGAEKTDLSWLRQTESGAIVFIMSSGCEACDLNAAAGLMIERPELAYLLLAEASEEEFVELQEELSGFPCRLARCEISAVADQTSIRVIPFMIALDSEGRAVGSGLFNTTADASAHAQALRIGVLTEQPPRAYGTATDPQRAGENAMKSLRNEGIDAPAQQSDRETTATAGGG